MSKHRSWSWSFALWAWVFLLAGIAPLLLMPRASAAEESDPYPDSENTKSNLDIYYPQDGPMVLEDKEYTEGSFTVVNKNDTNGNGQPDVDDDDMSATGEVDLMKLVARPPNVVPGKNAVLTVKKGNIKLWETKNKKTPITLEEGNKLTIPPAQLPRTMWVEARETTDANLALHDIEIELEYDGVKDTVRATSVWSERSHFWNTAKAGTPKTLNGEEDEDKVLNYFTKYQDSELGMGTFHAAGPNSPLCIGGRPEQEFVMYPPGIGAYVGQGKPVLADTSRQAAWKHQYILAGDLKLINTKSFPPPGPNQFELANDDTDVPPDDPIDEDDVPVAGSDKIYQLDGPGVGINNSVDFLILRCSFRDFVRFKFGPGQSFVTPGNCVDGSRGSPLEPWHLLCYSKRNQLALGLALSFVKDDANPSVSFAVPAQGNTGNGTCEGTANADNAVTEGWTVVYNAGTDTWAVTSTPPGSTGTLTKTDATHWTGNASNGGNVRISITVTAGGTAFANGDTFKFSTFKSTASGGKKYEIETGPCTVTDGP